MSTAHELERNLTANARSFNPRDKQDTNHYNLYNLLSYYYHPTIRQDLCGYRNTRCIVNAIKSNGFLFHGPQVFPRCKSAAFLRNSVPHTISSILNPKHSKQTASFQ